MRSVGSGDSCDDALLCLSSQQLLLDELFILAAATAPVVADVLLMLDWLWRLSAIVADGVGPLTSNTSESESSHTTLVSMDCTKEKKL